MAKKKPKKSGTQPGATRRTGRTKPSTGPAAAAGAKRGVKTAGPGGEPGAAAAPGRSRERAGVEREAGPRGWLFPIMEAAYSKLVPRGEGVPAPPPQASRRAAAAVAQAARASEEEVDRVVEGVNEIIG